MTTKDLAGYKAIVRDTVNASEFGGRRMLRTTIAC